MRAFLLLLNIYFFVFTQLGFSQAEVNYFSSGLTKHNSNDFNGAIRDFSVAIQINPDNPVPYYCRGLSKAELKDHKGAIEDYSKSIQLRDRKSVV